MSFDERIRFPLQVVREVQRRLPAGFPVGFRLLLREWAPGGIDLEEALAFAARLAAEGISYVSPSVATYHSMFLPEVRAFTARPGYLKEDAFALKQNLSVPVIVSGRVLTPLLAEQLLAEGAGDLIGLGRALRADPRWVVKARTGRRDRACRNCNLCLRRVVLEQGFTCARWPGWIQEKTDLEQIPLAASAGRGSVTAGLFGHVSGVAVRDLNVGESVRFGMQLSRAAGSGDLTGGACQLRVQIVSRDGESSPF